MHLLKGQFVESTQKATDVLKSDYEHGAREIFTMAEKLQEQYQRFASQVSNYKNSTSDPTTASIAKDVAESFRHVMESFVWDPSSVMHEQMNLMHQQTLLWQRTALKFLGHDVDPVIIPERSDRRFKDKAWSENTVYDYVKQFYLLQSQCILNILKSSAEKDEESTEKKMAEFFGRQFVNALAPTNFAATNPEVIRKTIETNGANLVDGMDLLLNDLEQSAGGLNVTMTDVDAFEVGDNVANTPGKVVFENEIFQLIQYTPSTENCFETPMLVVPPFINKYYILDLREKNSFVKWLVDQGHTTFIISWVNPGVEHSEVTFSDYLTDGVLAAIDAVKKAANVPSVNAVGYCVGGTLLASTAAYMASKRMKSLKSTTYLTTLLDFTDPGEIGVFINEKIIKSMEAKMLDDGYFDGRSMAFSFNLLRENDLFWSFFINNYLKGEPPAAFDLLYWNTDSANLPGRLHAFYLKNMYLNNALKEPGGLCLADVSIDLGKVKTPSFFLSTEQDHIAKWKSTYAGVHLLKGKNKFVLSGSGHIAGVVNPPASNKYGYRTNDNLPETPEQWLENAEQHEGSWWPHWQVWLTENGFAGQEKPARQPGDGKLSVIEDAPGRYVCQKISDVIQAPANDA